MKWNDWAASLKSRAFPGGHCSGGTMEPIGTATFHLALYDAGVHTGRDVNLVIPPKDLDVFARIIADAIKARDAFTNKGVQA